MNDEAKQLELDLQVKHIEALMQNNYAQMQNQYAQAAQNQQAALNQYQNPYYPSVHTGTATTGYIGQGTGQYYPSVTLTEHDIRKIVASELKKVLVDMGLVVTTLPKDE